MPSSRTAAGVNSIAGHGWDGICPRLNNGDEKQPLLIVIEHRAPPEILKILLDAGLPPDLPLNSHRQTALMLASANGYHAYVVALLAAGADVNLVGRRRQTALMCSCKGGHATVARALLDAGAPTDETDADGNTALHHAARRGQVVCVGELIERGANLTVRNLNGQTPVAVACREDQPLIAGLLLDEEGFRDDKRKRLDAELYLEVKEHNDHGAEQRRLRHQVEILLDAEGCSSVNSPDADAGRTPLHWAVHYGRLELVEHLLNAGADVNRRDVQWETAFSVAVRLGRRDAMRQLVAAGCDVTVTDSMFGTALHTAAREGLVDVVPLLIDAGLDVNLKCVGGVTPLMMAAGAGHRAVVDCLLELGANTDVVDRHHATALIYAILSADSRCRGGGDETATAAIVRSLVRYNCDLDVPVNVDGLCRQLGIQPPPPPRSLDGTSTDGKRQYSPLEVAFVAGRDRIFRMLINGGCNVDDRFELDASEYQSLRYGSTKKAAAAVRWYNTSPSYTQKNARHLLLTLALRRRTVRSLAELCRRLALKYLSSRAIPPNAVDRARDLPGKVRAFLAFDDIDIVDSTMTPGKEMAFEYPALTPPSLHVNGIGSKLGMAANEAMTDDLSINDQLKTRDLNITPSGDQKSKFNDSKIPRYQKAPPVSKLNRKTTKKCRDSNVTRNSETGFVLRKPVDVNDVTHERFLYGSLSNRQSFDTCVNVATENLSLDRSMVNRQFLDRSVMKQQSLKTSVTNQQSFDISATNQQSFNRSVRNQQSFDTSVTNWKSSDRSFMNRQSLDRSVTNWQSFDTHETNRRSFDACVTKPRSSETGSSQSGRDHVIDRRRPTPEVTKPRSFNNNNNKQQDSEVTIKH